MKVLSGKGTDSEVAVADVDPVVGRAGSGVAALAGRTAFVGAGDSLGESLSVGNLKETLVDVRKSELGSVSTPFGWLLAGAPGASERGMLIRVVISMLQGHCVGDDSGAGSAAGSGAAEYGGAANWGTTCVMAGVFMFRMS